MTEEMDKRDEMEKEEDAVEAETRPMDEEVGGLPGPVSLS